MRATRVHCPFCKRLIAITAKHVLATHNTASRSGVQCKGSGQDVSAEVLRMDEEDHDDWRSWLSK